MKGRDSFFLVAENKIGVGGGGGGGGGNDPQWGAPSLKN